MELPEIDEKKTIANVDKLLKKYHTFRRLAGQPIPQRLTSVITEEPKGSSNGHTIDDRIIDKLSYAEIYRDINKAISILDAQSQNLLWGKYIAEDRRTDYERYTQLCVSHVTYYRWLDSARLKFSEAYRDGELIDYQ